MAIIHCGFRTKNENLNLKYGKDLITYKGINNVLQHAIIFHGG